MSNDRIEQEDKNLLKRLAIENQVTLLNQMIAQEVETIKRIGAKAKSKIDNLLINRIPGLEKKRDDYLKQAKELSL